MRTDPATGLTCRPCGADNAPGADFCWRCYAPFHAVAPARPAGAHGTGPSWMSSRMPVPGPTVKKRRSYRWLTIAVAVAAGMAAYGSLSRSHLDMPEAIGAVPRMYDATSQRFQAEVATWSDESGGLSLQGAAYGSGVIPEFAVAATDEAVQNDPDDILRLVVASLFPGGRDTATLTGADGSFEYRCVQTVSRVSICVWKEPNSSGFVAANGRTPADALRLTRTVRDALET
jgi:hypothetical protein